LVIAMEMEYADLMVLVLVIKVTLEIHVLQFILLSL